MVARTEITGGREEGAKAKYSPDHLLAQLLRAAAPKEKQINCTMTYDCPASYHIMGCPAR